MSVATVIPVGSLGHAPGGGAAVTVTAAVPRWPSLVAVMVTAPTASPLTSPLPLTVPSSALLVAHVTTRPLSGLPLASFGVAVSCPVCPAITLTDAGLTATEATGTFVTVTVAVPLWPSLVAVIVAVPAPTPLTSLLPLTVATAVLRLAQVTTRPVSGLPLASFGVAVSCTLAPTGTLAVAGLTATDATGTFVTVTVAVPLWPSLVAVIVAVPAATPLTRPLPLTVATAVLLLAHVTTRPVSGLPLASFGVAVSCTLAPTGTLAVAGLTATDATGTFVAVTVAVPLWPSLVAVIVAVPAATPLTRPLPLTVATAVLLLAQVTTRPVSGLPLASLGVAVSCTLAPTSTLAVAGLTATDATEGGGSTVTVMVAAPLWPSLVAVIVAVPAITPLTRPLPLTPATAILLLPHVTTRPLSGLPLASLGVAVSCTLAPTGTLAVAGLTATEATGTFVTVTMAVPLWPSLVAV